MGRLQKTEYNGLDECHLQNVGIVSWLLALHHFLLRLFKLLQLIFHPYLNGARDN